MAYNLVRLFFLTNDEKFKNKAEEQLDFLAQNVFGSPMNHAMFLRAFLEYTKPPIKITVVADKEKEKSELSLELPSDAVAIVLEKPTDEYALKNGKTTYYVCRGYSCMPPTNDLNELNY